MYDYPQKAAERLRAYFEQYQQQVVVTAEDYELYLVIFPEGIAGDRADGLIAQLRASLPLAKIDPTFEGADKQLTGLSFGVDPQRVLDGLHLASLGEQGKTDRKGLVN